MFAPQINQPPQPASYREGESDPRGAETGPSKVLRGGSYKDRADTCRLAFRFARLAGFPEVSIGFRVARSFHD
jgi:formylglycine-generating enzyme required for sulfatase activity